MTRGQIIQLVCQARQEVAAKLPPNHFDLDLFYERLAALVEAAARADEREQCARVADYVAVQCLHPDEIAAAIRAMR